MSGTIILIIIALLAVIAVGLIIASRSNGGSNTKASTAVTWSAVPILNASELRLHAALVRLVPLTLGEHVRILAQVNLGEFLKCSDRSSFLRINAKRADFVLVDRDFRPLATIEYQGSGHRGPNSKSAQNAMERDAVKRHALSQAGIPMIEVPAKWSDEAIVEMLSSVMVDAPRSYTPTSRRPRRAT